MLANSGSGCSKKNKLQKIILLQDKTGVNAAIARKRAGLPEVPSIKPTIKEVEPAIAKEEIEGLPLDIFTEVLDLNKGKFLCCFCLKFNKNYFCSSNNFIPAFAPTRLATSNC